MKTWSCRLEKVSDVVDNKVAKNTKFNTLKTKVNNLEKEIPDAITLIYVNQYNTDKKIQTKKLEIMIKNTTILAKIYETNFSVSAKQRTTGKVQC